MAQNRKRHEGSPALVKIVTACQSPPAGRPIFFATLPANEEKHFPPALTTMDCLSCKQEKIFSFPTLEATAKGKSMANVPTPEKSGQEILAVFGEFFIRPGEMLVHGSLYPAVLSKGFRREDWEHGLTWLTEQGFVEIPRNQPLSYFLTEKGFAQL